MKRILRIGMDVHSTNYTLCAMEQILGEDDRIFANTYGGYHAVYIPTEEDDSVKEYLRMRDDHKRICGVFRLSAGGEFQCRTRKPDGDNIGMRVA